MKTVQAAGPITPPLQAWFRLHDHADEAVFAKDLEGRYWYMNDAGAAMLGRNSSDVIGRDDFELFAEDSARAMRERERAILDAGCGRSYESVATAGGRTRVYRSSKDLWFGADGSCIGLIGLSRDITPEKSLRDSVAEVASTVSHGLKTPLTALRLRLELLRRPGGVRDALPDGGGQEAFLAMIDACSRDARRLTDLIDEAVGEMRRLAGR